MTQALQQLSIFYYGQKHKLDEIVLDAVIKEHFELRAQASEHPTESSQSFCDHVQLLPTTIQIEGIISNTPMNFTGLTAVNSLHSFAQGQSNDFAQKAFAKLEAIFAKGEPITIATSLKDYENMVLESLNVERNAHTCASLHFTATAKQIRMVNQSVINMPAAPKLDRAKPKRQMGRQETKKAASEPIKKAIKKQSALAMFTDWAGTLWR